MTTGEAVFAIEHMRAVARACYGQDPQEAVKNSTLPSISTRPSIHLIGLLQWQAEEFDRAVSARGSPVIVINDEETIDDTRDSTRKRMVGDQRRGLRVGMDVRSRV